MKLFFIIESSIGNPFYTALLKLESLKYTSVCNRMSTDVSDIHQQSIYTNLFIPGKTGAKSFTFDRSQIAQTEKCNIFRLFHCTLAH